jgi:hypothetical protein
MAANPDIVLAPTRAKPMISASVPSFVYLWRHRADCDDDGQEASFTQTTDCGGHAAEQRKILESVGA